MSIALKYWPLIPAAFVGLMSWFGPLGPANAAEAASALRSPAARLGELSDCRVVSPTFEPKGREYGRPFAAKFAGGAKLQFPVANSCERARRPLDV